MKFEVSEAVIAQTTMCHCDFQCLEAGTCNGRPICEVENFPSVKALFISCDEASARIRACPYLIHFGSGAACECPTRQAIFKEYHR